MTAVDACGSSEFDGIAFRLRTGVLSKTGEMSNNCQDYHHHHHHPQQHQQQQWRRSTRFKRVVRRVLYALSFHVGRHAAKPPSLPAAEGGDDCAEGVDGCGGGLVMTSTSTVAMSVCRLAAVEEEQARSRCNSLVRHR